MSGSTLGRRFATTTPTRTEDAHESTRLVEVPYRQRDSKRARSRSRTRTPTQRLYDRQLTVVAIVLLVAAAVTLYTAYVLLSETWRRATTSEVSSQSDHLTDPVKIVQYPPIASATADSVTSPTVEAAVAHTHAERYLAYLPHSGFHNQRIALENALVLSRILNRTLLLPQVRLGLPLTYVLFDDLYELSGNSSKTALAYCSGTTSQDWDLLPECEDYTNYTYISWDWLVDLSPIRQQQTLLEGWNFTDAWLLDVLNISADAGDIFYLKDYDRNQYVFEDFLSSDPPTRKFSESIHIGMLARRPEPLIQLGTLFGSARLFLRSETNFAMRGLARECMAFTNPVLVSAAASIRDRLGGTYLGVHLRIANGVFDWNAPENVRVAWWKLMTLLGYTEEELLVLEQEFFPEEDVLEAPTIAPDLPALRSPHPPLPPLPRDAKPASGFKCRGPLHVDARLKILNVPLFVSTDAHNPSLNPLLWRFVRTFPCSFFLEDFEEQAKPLDALRSETDGVPIGRFLTPFLDAMVAGQAWQVVGTEQSTFSSFVTDVLWRRYHGFEIVQRG